MVGKKITVGFNPERNKVSLLLLFIFLFVLSAAAQTDNSKTELIYLQTSKGIYETGEDLWFKAYILDAQYLVPSDLSKTLYLQLVNEKTGAVAWQELYEIVNRFVAGHVYLNDTLPEGNYLLEAFTPHSFFNDSTEFEAMRKIVVRKDMKPRVNIKPEFTRSSFSKGDSVGFILHALSAQSEPLYAVITAKLMKNGEVLETKETVTDEKGTAELFFNPVLTGPDLTLSIEAKHTNSTETLKLEVPFHEGSLVQFNLFPEGGYLVSGLQNRLAFKAVNTKGEPLEVGGTLFENGDSLFDFQSYHAGMGSFDFVPDYNKSYHIKLDKPLSDSVWQLPEMRPSGIILHLARRDSNFLWFVVKQPQGSKDTVVCLRGQLHGNVYCFQSGVLKDEVEIKISQHEFPQQGIAEFTLLNENMQPMAERLVYVNPENRLNIKAKLSKEKYSLREKATLNLEVTDQYNRPVVAHLGISVFDKIYQNTNDPKNILTHCYLSTQLNGRIYDPLYYFDKNNINRQEALDLLLLTQGWRKYVWNSHETNDNSLTSEQKIIDGIKGTIRATNKVKKAPTGNLLIKAYNPAQSNNKYLLLSDSIGKFDIAPDFLKLGQGGHVYLEAAGRKEFDYEIVIEFPFDKINKFLLSKNVIYPDKIEAGNTRIQPSPFKFGPNVIKLEEITITGNKKYQFKDKYLGYLDSLAQVHFDPGDYVCLSGILNCPVHKGHPRNTKPIEGKKYTQYVNVSWNDIRRRSFTFTGYTTTEYHRPKFTEEFLLEFNNLARVKGYYFEREFYQPQYDKIDSLDRIPDYRNTLLWAPSVLTDREGKATVEFFCSDIYTGFTGIIEGVSGDGKLGHQTFEFEVRKTGPFSWEKQ